MRFLKWIAIAVLALFLVQPLAHRPLSQQPYPIRVPIQLRQASRDWEHMHDGVRLARQVRHALLPMFDRKKQTVIG
jgi:hypothetical protein